MSNNYPKTDSTDFYKKINIIYGDQFTIKKPKEKQTMKELCLPKKFKLQEPQKFISNYINPKTPYTGILVYHKIGSGKTCTAIQIGEKWKHKRKIFVVVPASLITNFKDELRSKCANEEYITNTERKLLKSLHPSDKEYKTIIKKSNERISEFYTIISYNKYVDLCDKKQLSLTNTVLMIDEIQNMISDNGTWYRKLYESIMNAPNNLRIILLSATPIFDKPNEIAQMMNLLRLPESFPTGTKFNDMFLEPYKLPTKEITYHIKNKDIFKQMIKGYVSYYSGADPITFPELEVKYVKCVMSDFQYKCYKTVMTREGPFKSGDLLNLPNNFFIGSRILSNIAFPNKETGENGYNNFKGEYLQMINLREYSVKFYKILKAIKKAEYPVFVYSNFKEYGGLKTLIKILHAHGYKNYKVSGQGPKRYAVWSGDEKIELKEEIKNVFNQKENKTGGLLKVILGSPAIKEGVTLLRVQEVHILEPYWNFSRIDQIIGRAVRYCSHKDLPPDQRKVTVRIYIATSPKDNMTVDKYILRLAKYKEQIIDEFELALKESAIDCKLNKYANKDNNIKCDV